MAKNILSIYLIIINLNLIFSTNNCDSINSPSGKNDCFSQNEDSGIANYCCYYESIKSSKKFCKTVPYSSLHYENLNYENIDGDLYEISCETNNRKVTLLEQCGDTNNPQNANFEKCKKHSTVLNSCCYVEGNANIEKGCYWLGTKYEGDITWAGVNMDCFMNYLKNSIINVIFIILILF